MHAKNKIDESFRLKTAILEADERLGKLAQILEDFDNITPDRAVGDAANKLMRTATAALSHSRKILQAAKLNRPDNHENPLSGLGSKILGILMNLERSIFQFSKIRSIRLTLPSVRMSFTRSQKRKQDANLIEYCQSGGITVRKIIVSLLGSILGLITIACLVGCGSGESTSKFDNRRHLLIGIDISGSNKLIEDQKIANKAAEKIKNSVSLFSLGDTVYIRTFGSYGMSNNLRSDYKVDRKEPPKK